MSKETSVWIKRDLDKKSTKNTWDLDNARRTAEMRQIWRQICQKRPLYKSKETYTRDLQRGLRFRRDAQLGSDVKYGAKYVKRDLCIHQKRPIQKSTKNTWDLDTTHSRAQVRQIWRQMCQKKILYALEYMYSRETFVATEIRDITPFFPPTIVVSFVGLFCKRDL